MTTKDKIIRAACEIFPAKGFHGTTLQDICERAGVNIAAVNYYYGSKDKLYFKVWETLNAIAEKNLDRVKAFDTPEKQLHQFIRVRVEGVLSDDAVFSPFPKLVHKEFGHPSPMHNAIMERFMQPKHEWFKQLIARIVGQSLDDSTLETLGFCIHSPLIHLLEIKNRDGDTPGPLARFRGDKEAFADTIFNFYLAGLKAVAPGHTRSGSAEVKDRAGLG